jgi:hypothetical protein
LKSRFSRSFILVSPPGYGHRFRDRASSASGTACAGIPLKPPASYAPVRPL